MPKSAAADADAVTRPIQFLLGCVHLTKRYMAKTWPKTSRSDRRSFQFFVVLIVGPSSLRQSRVRTLIPMPTMMPSKRPLKGTARAKMPPTLQPVRHSYECVFKKEQKKKAGIHNSWPKRAKAHVPEQTTSFGHLIPNV